VSRTVVATGTEVALVVLGASIVLVVDIAVVVSGALPTLVSEFSAATVTSGTAEISVTFCDADCESHPTNIKSADANKNRCPITA
jgi:hypothetical protein